MPFRPRGRFGAGARSRVNPSHANVHASLKEQRSSADDRFMITYLAGCLLLAPTALADDEHHVEGEGHVEHAGDHGDVIRADRPDTTQSPYTVPEGMFQLEHSLVSVAFEHEEGEPVTRVVAGGFLAKAGLTPFLDFEVGWDGYAIVVAHEHTAHGAGDPLLRVKWNIVGHDGGAVALAVLPYVFAPAGDDEIGRPNWSGGLIVPFSAQLSHAFHLGAMVEGSISGDENAHVHSAVVASLALGIHVAGPWELFFEFVSELELGDHVEWIPETNVGTAFTIGSDVRIDAGFDVAYHSEGVAYEPFLGLSWRI